MKCSSRKGVDFVSRAWPFQPETPGHPQALGGQVGVVCQQRVPETSRLALSASNGKSQV